MGRDTALTVPYRFCDVALLLSAERQSAIEAFNRIYGAFRAREAGTRQVACRLCTDDAGRGSVLIDGRRVGIAMDDPGGAYAAWLIWEAVAAASATHRFLHASAVAVGGRAAVFVGPTGHGKTTLAAAVARAGAEPLNDDITPVERITGVAEHFPKGEPGEMPDPGRRVPVAAYFVLGPHARGAELRVAIDSWPGGEAGARADLQSLGAEVAGRGDHLEIVLRRSRPGSVDAITGLCRARGVTVLRELGSMRPAFGDEPRLWSAPAHEAALELAANVFGRSERTAADLIWDVTGVLGGARVFGVQPGPPGAAAAEVLSLLR